MFFDLSSFDSQVVKDASNIQSSSNDYKTQINGLEVGVFIWVFLSFALGLTLLILNCIAINKDYSRLALVNGVVGFFLISCSVALVAMKHG